MRSGQHSGSDTFLGRRARVRAQLLAPHERDEDVWLGRWPGRRPEAGARAAAGRDDNVHFRARLFTAELDGGVKRGGTRVRIFPAGVESWRVCPGTQPYGTVTERRQASG